VFQELGVFPWMNVIDNICFGLEMQGIPKQDRYRMALPLIDKLGLNSFIKHYPHNLSLGMKQRVGLARALVSRAEILLMDEPFASLDAQMRHISQQKLVEVSQEYKKSVIYVTHDIEEALLLGDRIIIFTARPATIKVEMKVNLPRPRDIDGVDSATFLRMKREIWESIREEVEKVAGYNE
jgi:NitT/TauT family transport system ATP-binding protein